MPDDNQQQQEQQQQEEEIVVNVVDNDQQQQDTGKEAAAPAEGQQQQSPPTKSGDDAVLDLGQQLNQMRQRAERSEARADASERREQAAMREVQSVRGQAADAEYDSVVAGIDALTTEANALARDVEEARAHGDTAKAAELNVKLGKTSARLTRLEEAKETIETKRESAKNAPPPQQQETDPVEAFAKTRTPPTAKWVREHPEFITDPKKFKKLQAAHSDAEAEGIPLDSEEYFKHIDNFVGLTKKDPPVQQRQPSRRAPAAPPNPTPSNGARVRTVELTRAEAEAATDGTHIWNYDDPTGKNRFKKGDPIGVQEFARRKALMKEQGHYDRTYSES